MNFTTRWEYHLCTVPPGFEGGGAKVRGNKKGNEGQKLCMDIAPVNCIHLYRSRMRESGGKYLMPLLAAQMPVKILKIISSGWNLIFTTLPFISSGA